MSVEQPERDTSEPLTVQVELCLELCLESNGNARTLPVIFTSAGWTDEEARLVDRWRRAVHSLDGYTAIGRYSELDHGQEQVR